MSTKGCIYILTNPSFPDYVKIGYASNIERRLTSLSASAQMIENVEHPVQGTIYWYYQGKSLKDYREELEKLGEYK